MKKLDLYMRSKYSDDGQYEPIELLGMYKAAGLGMMVTTGHNSARGSQITLRHRQEYGIAYIPAIEVDTVPQDVGCHILRYETDVHNPVFGEIEGHVVSQEREASKCHHQLVRDMGVVSGRECTQKLSPDGITTGKVIGEAAMEYDVEKKNPLLQLYYPGGERSDDPFVNFYRGIYILGEPVYAEVFYPSVGVIVELLHQQDALAIVVYPGMSVREQVDCIHGLLQLGVGGFEVSSSYHSEQQMRFYYDLTKNHGLYVICGSDFHGKTKSVVHIGVCSMEEEENTCLVRKLETLRT